MNKFSSVSYAEKQDRALQGFQLSLKTDEDVDVPVQ